MIQVMHCYYHGHQKKAIMDLHLSNIKLDTECMVVHVIRNVTRKYARFMNIIECTIYTM